MTTVTPTDVDQASGGIAYPVDSATRACCQGIGRHAPGCPESFAETGRFTGDRYDRLIQAAEVLASDPAIENADSLFNGAFIRAFVNELVEANVLDGMSGRDCDTFAMLAVIDATQGPARLAWRIHRWLEGDQLSRDTDNDNPFAVCSALSAALKLMIDAFVDAFATEAAERE